MSIFDLCGMNAGQKAADPEIVKVGLAIDDEIASIRRFYKDMVTDVTQQADKVLKQQSDLLNGLRANVRHYLDAEINQQRLSLQTLRDSVAAQTYVSMDEFLLGLQMQGLPVDRVKLMDTNVTGEQGAENEQNIRGYSLGGPSDRSSNIGSAGTVSRGIGFDSGGMEKAGGSVRPAGAVSNANSAYPASPAVGTDASTLSSLVTTGYPSGRSPFYSDYGSGGYNSNPTTFPTAGPMRVFYVWANAQTCEWLVNEVGQPPFGQPWESQGKYTTYQEAFDHGITWYNNCTRDRPLLPEPVQPPTVPGPVPPYFQPVVVPIPPTTPPTVPGSPLPPFVPLPGPTLPSPVPGCPGSTLNVHCPSCGNPVIQNYVVLPPGTVPPAGVPAAQQTSPVGIEQPYAFRWQQRSQPWYRDAITWGGPVLGDFANSLTADEYLRLHASKTDARHTTDLVE